MSSKKKSQSLGQRFISWFKGEHKNPTMADCMFAIARVEWDLLQLKLAVRKGDFLIAKRKRELEDFEKPWYKRRPF